MGDEEIIALFFERSEKAISELDKKYGRTCHLIASNILKNNQDAEECVSDAYLGVWNAVPPQNPKPLSTFLYRIIRNISVTRYYKNTAKKRNSFYDVALSEIEEIIACASTPENEVEGKVLTGMIESFLDGLDKESRVIFVRRYWLSDSYEEIAKLTGLSVKNISVKLTRLRKKLKEYLSSQEVI